ncbi:hypothetical protein [Desulforudis sp. DRI-14]|uniref:hypothetical protein n=1 Tax=Desulforudis sp. DRI-14 TaxID=3459793 RepID=UPI00404271F5
MQNAVVIGLGDVCLGDMGAGSYVIEALSQENLGEYVDLADISCYEVFDLEMHLYRKDYAVLVYALARGYPGGHVSQVTCREALPSADMLKNGGCSKTSMARKAKPASGGAYRAVREHWTASMTKSGEVFQLPLAQGFFCGGMRPVYERLHMAKVFGVLPPEVTLVVIEPQKVCHGLELTGEVRSAVRKAVRLIKNNLMQRGFLPSSPVTPLLRYRMDLLQTTI